MPDMGLPLAYGAGTAPDTLESILKERLLRQEYERRLAEDAAQAQYQQGTLGVATERNAIEREQMAQNAPLLKARTRSEEVGATKSEWELGEAQRGSAERDTALAGLPPTVRGLVTLGMAGKVDPYDPTGATGYQRDMDLQREISRRTLGAANIAASARQGQLGRGQIRTVPNALSEGNFGVPQGTPVTAIVVVGTDEAGTPTAERVGEVPVGLTAGQKEQATGLGSVREQLRSVREMFDANPSLTGPVIGRAEKVAGSIGTNLDPNRARMAAALQSARNMLIYARSGKQINEQEYYRLMQEMPDISQDAQTFQLRLQNIEQNMDTLMQTLGRVGQGPIVGAAPGGPQVGDQRIVNGQLAEWDGRGWKAVR